MKQNLATKAQFCVKSTKLIFSNEWLNYLLYTNLLTSKVFKWPSTYLEKLFENSEQTPMKMPINFFAATIILSFNFKPKNQFALFNF